MRSTAVASSPVRISGVPAAASFQAAMRMSRRNSTGVKREKLLR